MKRYTKDLVEIKINSMRRVWLMGGPWIVDKTCEELEQEHPLRLFAHTYVMRIAKKVMGDHYATRSP